MNAFEEKFLYEIERACKTPRLYNERDLLFALDKAKQWFIWAIASIEITSPREFDKLDSAEDMIEAINYIREDILVGEFVREEIDRREYEHRF